MNYLAYTLLALLLACSANGTSTEAGSEKVQKLFNTFQSHMSACPREGDTFDFYVCPSHFWPEILHNFIPVARGLEAWIRHRIGGGDAFWYLWEDM